MTVSVSASGSLTANGTEQQLATGTTAGTYELVVDRSNMADGDTLVLNIYDQVTSSSSLVLARSVSFNNAQTEIVTKSIPFTCTHQYKVTLQQTAGTNRVWPWELRLLG